MSKYLGDKLNKLLTQPPKKVVLTSTWLQKEGFSSALLSKYVSSNWLNHLGYGAYIRVGEEVDILGAVSALHFQLAMPVHLGGLSALELAGLAHNVIFNQRQNQVMLFNTLAKKTNLPKWFRKNYSHHQYFQYYLFDSNVGLEKNMVDNVEVIVSSAERAILEVIALTPAHFDYAHVNYLMEGLQLLRPDVMQKLLESCRSIKVKRLFLYLADKFQLPSFSHLQINKINLGSGNRVIGEGGVFVPKYQLSVPKLKEDILGIADV